MTPLFADTYYFLALLGVQDPAHPKALALSRQVKQEGRLLITTAWVLTELGDALAASVDRHLFARTVVAIKCDPRFVIIPATEALFNAGLGFYESRSDKEWGFTDCTSFVVMQEHGITEALTGDHHFEQAGFKALLKE